MEEMEKREEMQEEAKEVSDISKNNISKEVKVEEKERNGNGKLVGYVAIVIAIIALVLSLANMGVRGTVKDLKKQTTTLAQKENVLEVKTMQIDLLSGLDRIYVLTLLERNYDAAAKEFTKVESIFNRIKGTLSEKEEKRLAGLLASLKAEIDKGPSPIPELISEIRASVSAISVSPVQSVKVEKPKAVVKAKPEKKVFIVKPQKMKEASYEEKESSSLKKAYEFWKNLGQKLVKK